MRTRCDRAAHRQRDIHVFDAVDDHAARAEQLGRHFIGVVAAIDRVARNQRQRGARRAPGFPSAAGCSRLGVAPSDQLALRPAAAAMHRCVDAARVRVFAGKAEVIEEVFARPGRAACTAA